MKTLYPPQQKACDFFVDRQLAGLSTLDTSDTGVGKTIVACRMMKQVGGVWGVVAPKATLTQWERALAEEGVTPLFVVSYEKLNHGKTGFFEKKITKRVIRSTGKTRTARSFKWTLPEGVRLVFDEVHRASSPTTGNARAHILATEQGVITHNLSATAAEDPTECRALGYALGLHGLNTSDRSKGLLPWESWMRKLGCSRDPWRNWKSTNKTRKLLAPVKEWLYENRAHKIKHADMPEAFRKNQIIEEPIDFGPELNKFYKEAGLTPDIIAHWMETGEAPDEENFLTAMLRARQLAELQKVGVVKEMIEDLVREGKSVVFFANFRETLAVLQAALPEMELVQGVSSEAEMEERQDAIDRFMSDRTRVLGVNMQAGGTGLSLHDVTGKHPRVALLSPSFDYKQFHQALGRVYRNGMQTDALQIVLVAAGTIEETVAASLRRKRLNMESLLG